MRRTYLALLVAGILAVWNNAKAQTNPPYWTDAIPKARNSPLLKAAEAIKVDEFSGSSAYSFPIPVPPGTGAATPSLALSYSSLTTASEYGWGWNLSLSKIERSTRRSPPKYNNAIDQFEIDGELLVRDPGTGDRRKRFHRERTRFDKIEFSCLPTDSCSAGGTWVITQPDGTQLRYGSQASSRLSNPNALTSGTTNVFQWRLDEVIDPKGNSYRVTYVSSCDDRNGDCVCNDLDGSPHVCPSASPAPAHLYPKFIDYSFHTTVSPLGNQQTSRQVEFLWDFRGYSGEDRDRPTSYRPGFQESISQRLVGIKTMVAGVQVARWEMVYEAKPTPNTTGCTDCARRPPFSQLKEIKRYSKSNDLFQGTTKFEYTRANLDGVQSPADVLPTTRFSEVSIVDSSVATELGAWSDMALIDLNGDGLLDRLTSGEYDCGTHTAWKVMFGRYPTPDNAKRFKVPQEWFWYDTGTTTPPADVDYCLGHSYPGSSGASYQYSRVQIIDIDGDGKSDYVEAKPNTTNGWAISEWRVRRSRGDGFGPLESWIPPSHSTVGAPVDLPPSGKTLGSYYVDNSFGYGTSLSRLLDADADGRPDHVLVRVIPHPGDFDEVRWSISTNGACDAIVSQAYCTGPGIPYSCCASAGNGSCCGFSPATAETEILPPVQDTSLSISVGGTTDREQLDVHGDGLPDLVSGAGSVTVYPSFLQVDKFAVDYSVTTNLSTALKLYSDDDTLRDINGDGVLDRIQRLRNGQQILGWVLNYGLGDGTFSPVDLSGFFWMAGSTAAAVDVDSDGLVEEIGSNQFGINSWAIRDHGDQGRPPGLLTKVTNELGGTTDISYQSTALYSGKPAVSATSQCPASSGSPIACLLQTLDATNSSQTIGNALRHYWVVSGVTVNDGLSGTTAQTRTIEYAEPRYDLVNRESYGLRMSAVTDGGGFTTRTLFHQDRFRRGLQQLAEVVSPSNCACTPPARCSCLVYGGTATAWTPYTPKTETSLEITGSGFAVPTKEQSWTGNANSTHQRRSICRGVTNHSTGNLDFEEDCGPDGDPATSSDDGLRKDYSYPSLHEGDPWLLRYPKEEQETGPNGAVLGRTFFLYDGHTYGYDHPPEKGLLKQRDRAISASATDCSQSSTICAREQWDYDAFGNPTAYRDPLRTAAGGVGPDTLKITYDSSYNAFPLTSKNRKNHTTSYRVSPQSGELMKRLDPNGLLECWVYDSFFRLSERRRHSIAVSSSPSLLDGTTCNTLLASFSYANFGTPSLQKIETTALPGGTAGILSKQFVDGLGRVYKEAKATETSDFSVSLNAWGTRGEVTCTGLPFLSSNPDDTALNCSSHRPYRTQTFDALLRPVDTWLHTPEDSAWGLNSNREATVAYSIEEDDADGPGPEATETVTTYGDYSRDGATATPPQVRRIAIDAHANLLAVQTGTGGNRTEFTRDALGRITRIDGPDVPPSGHANIIALDYDMLGRRTSLTQAATTNSPPSGPTWQYTWDVNGNLITERPPRGSGFEIIYTYDELNRIINKDAAPPDDQSQDDVNYTYDLNTPSNVPNKGYLSRISDAAGTRIFEAREYDIFGNLVRKQRDISSAKQGDFIYGFDQLGRRTYVRYPDHVSLDFSYSGPYLTGIINHVLGTQYVGQIKYHATGRLAELAFLSDINHVARSKYTIDSGTLLPSRALARLNGTANDPNSGTYVDGQAYYYDLAGNLREASTVGGLGLTEYLSETFTYDSLHRLDEARATSGAWKDAYNGPANLLKHTYDNAGNLTKKGKWNLGYAAGGQPAHAMTSVSDGVNTNLAYTYDQDGHLRYRSGTFEGAPKDNEFTWNADNHLVSYKATTSAGSVTEYKYDAGGSRIWRQLPSGQVGSRTYIDDEYEIEAAIPGTPAIPAFQVKHVFVDGKRILSLYSDIDVDTAPQDNIPDRYYCDGFPVTGWNDEAPGSITYGIPNACLCGDFNQDGLLSVSDLIKANQCIFNPDLCPSPATPDLLGDANGDGLTNVQDITALNVAIFNGGCYAKCGRVWTGGQGTWDKRAMCRDTERPQKERRYHVSPLGTNRLATTVQSQNGVVLQRTLTRPFGDVVAVLDQSGNLTSAVTDYLFVDKGLDSESGLYYFGARYYDPIVGRFVSTDPELIGAAGGVTFEDVAGNPQALNAYDYGYDRPTSLVDPDGRMVLDVFGSAPFGWGTGAGSRFVSPPTVWGGSLNVCGALGGCSVLRPAAMSIPGAMNLDPNQSYGIPAQSPAIPAPAGVSIEDNIAKAESRSMWSQPLKMYWFYRMVRGGGPWDYKRVGGPYSKNPDSIRSESPYEKFGNFNYGATGRALGISLTTLLREAGRAQPKESQEPEWGKPGIPPWGGTGSYGDDPNDAYWIKRGWDYYGSLQH